MLLITSCSQSTTNYKGLNGIWECVGYGWLLEISDSTEYAFYDGTNISCVSRRHASLDELYGTLELKGDSLFLKRGVLTYRFTRLDALPAGCSQTAPTGRAEDPLHNFDVFAETVSKHYVFMELNEINWDSLRQTQRQKVAGSPVDTTLYLVMEETLSLLRDNHAYLEASGTVYELLTGDDDEGEATPEGEGLVEYGDFQVAALTAEHHMEEELTRDSWLIQWGWLADGTGYIMIKAMWLYAELEIPESAIEEMGYVDAFVETFHQMDEGNYIQKEVAGVRSIMDRIMDDLRGADRMVLDVRFNGGGQDAVSFEVLRHFNEKRRKVGLQQVKTGDSLSPKLPLYLEASNDPFLKPVFILTSPQTGSAAEAFSLASLSLPHVRRIGSATSGALSTSLEKKLPNGWVFSISNELFMDMEGNFYENRGIPVDYDLQYPQDRQMFFRAVAGNLDQDEEHILRAVEELGN